MATKSISNNVLGIVIAIALVFGGGMFFAGMKYGESKNPSSTGAGQFAGRSGAFFRRGGGTTGSGGSFANGSVISKDSQSVTVKTQNGSSKIVYFSGSTQVGKFDTGSASDLKTGDQVMVNGTSNPDGSIAAQDIEIRPAGSPGFAIGGRTGGATGSQGQQSGG